MISNLSADVALNVRRAIDNAGKTIDEVSQSTGIPRTTLQRRINSLGKSPFTVIELDMLAHALGTPVQSLTKQGMSA